MFSNLAILNAFLWLSNHFSKTDAINKISLVLVSDTVSQLYKQQQQQSQKLAKNVQILTISEYIERFWIGKNQEFVSLYESIKSVLEMTKREQEGSKKSTQQNEYASYLDDEELDIGVKTGSILRGKFYVANSRFGEAYLRVSDDSGMSQDVLLSGRLRQNRAVQGDVVYVQLLPENEWESPPTGTQLSADLVDSDDEGNDPNNTSSSTTTTNNTTTTTPKQMEMKPIGKVVPSGKVVGIHQRNWRSFVATIQIDKDTTVEDMVKKERVICVPMDKKIPKIRIKTRQTSELLNQRIVVRIDSWEDDSRYPNGHYVHSLGPIGAINTEISALLLENEVKKKSF